MNIRVALLRRDSCGAYMHTGRRRDGEMEGWSLEEWIRSELVSRFAVYWCLPWSPCWGDTWCAVIVHHTLSYMHTRRDTSANYRMYTLLCSDTHTKAGDKRHGWRRPLIIRCLSQWIVAAGALHGAESSLRNPRALLKRETDRNEVLYLKQASFFINEYLFRQIWSGIRCMLTSWAFQHFSSKYIQLNAFSVLFSALIFEWCICISK